MFCEICIQGKNDLIFFNLRVIQAKCQLFQIYFLQTIDQISAFRRSSLCKVHSFKILDLTAGQYFVKNLTVTI